MLKKLPITVIGGILTIFIGTAIWFFLDATQSQKVESLLNKDIDITLNNELSDARVRLTDYIDSFVRSSYLISRQIESNSHSLAKMAQNNLSHQHSINTSPNWGITRQLWQYHSLIDYAFVFDQEHHLYEFLNRSHKEPFTDLINFDSHLIELSLDDSYLLKINDTPILISSHKITISDNSHYLMIVKIIDDNFLLESQKNTLNQGKVIALFDKDPVRIIASTAPSSLSHNASVQAVTQRYKIASKEFFDYGNSELEIQFALLIPINLYKNLNIELLALDRKNRLIVILIMSIAMLLGLLVLVRSILNLANKVSHHSSQTFHTAKHHQIAGNEFTYLNKVFDRFALRALSDRQIEEQRYASNAKSLQLSVLGGITTELNVGVILKENRTFRPTNSVMEEYIKDCGDIELFTQDLDHKEIRLLDLVNKRRVFKRSHILLESGTEAIIVQDTTELSLHSEALEEMALHDALTGLPNRVLLHDRIETGIKLSNREHKPCILFMMDLNRFKNVNDTLGHSTGDELLKQVANRMSDEIRETDTISRIGGDEFAILLINTDLEWSKKIALKLKQTISEPFHIMNNTIEIGVSIGIASAEDVHDGEDLLSQADIAMYHAKREKLDYCFYSQDIDPDRSERLMIIESIKSGIEQQQFKLYYQPQITPSDHTFIAFEALVRWEHPTLGFLNPDMFISIAEENGYINELTQYIFTTAIYQCEAWLAKGYRINISINLSAANLQDVSLMPYIGRVLEESTIEPNQITLEITESMLMQDQSDIIEKLDAIKLLGMRLSIDDFGTGYSSLAYLRHMPVDELKIDRSFISDIQSKDGDLKLIRSIIDLAHNLDLEVVAEGVETEVHKDILSKMKCERLQGYFYSKPMKAEHVLQWIHEHYGDEIETI